MNKQTPEGVAGRLDADVMPADFAGRLKLLMRVSRVTATELARRTGLEPSAISHFTTGGREPNLENLAKLLRALPGADARWMVTGDEA